MIESLYDNLTGDQYEYNTETGLIARNGSIVSGAEFEPVFTAYPEDKRPPIFVGLFLKMENKFLSLGGNKRSLINSRQL